jgi:hypothetical protein
MVIGIAVCGQTRTNSEATCVALRLIAIGVTKEMGLTSRLRYASHRG